MTSVDVGDAFELTFITAVGATVTVSWFDPDGATVLDAVEVTENPALSGKYPYTFLPTAPGTWSAIFASSGTAVAVERYWVRATAFTGPPPLAVLGDVSGQFGTLTDAQQTLASVLLRAASKMIRSRFPLTDSQITAGRLDADLVALAVTNMVLRVLRNPGGLRSETVGPFSRAYDTTAAAGLLVITPGEEALMVPTPPAGSSGLTAGTIMLKPGLAPRPYGVRGAWRRG